MDQKSKTRVSNWWRCISLFVYVFRVKASIHSPTWKLKQNKCTYKCSKKGNTPRKWWFKSNQFKRIHVLTSFCLANGPQRKTSVSHAGPFEKKNEFAPASVQVGSSSRTFHPEVTSEGGKVQSKKLYLLKCKLLYSRRVFDF